MPKKTASLIFLLLALTGTAFSQFTCYCCDSTTVVAAVHHVYRTGGNNVETLVGTQITGDYWYDWAAYVSANVSVNSSVIESGTSSVDYGGNNQIFAGGTAAGVTWNNAPSTYGPGTYSQSGYHIAASECGDYGTATSSDSLTVNQPSFTQSNAGNAIPQTLWNMGPGTDAAILTSNGYTYYQSITLTINTNCNPGDTCNDTPQWSISSPANTLYLSPTSGTSVTLSTGPSMGNCTADTPVSVSLGGFSSNSVTFTTNSPGRVTDKIAYYLTEGSGYVNQVTWQISDVCPGGTDRLTVLPLHEAFGTWTVESGTSGWNPPTPTALSFDVSDVTFSDYVRADCPFCLPTPSYSSNGYQYFTPIMQSAQQYYAGSSTVPSTSGAQIYSGTITFYQDHGDTSGQ